MQKKYYFWFFIAILCLFLSCISTSYDYDLYARLIVGEQFVEHGIIHFEDFLSYTPTHHWYDHEWGSGVVFYLVLKYLGAFGIILLQALMFLGIAFFVAKTQKLQKHSYPVSLIFISLFLTLFWFQNPTLIRCQIFSFFFFSMFLYILEKSKKTSTNLIWIIPFIIPVWNNLHGGVVSGLGLVVIYLIGAILEKKDWKKYLYILLTSTPLLVINPYGYKYLQFLFSATTMNRKYITEWWPFYASRHILYYIWMSLYGMYGFMLECIKSFKQKKADFTKLIILTVTLVEGLMHVKLLSLTIIAVSALCYNEIYISLKWISKNIKKHIEKSLYAVIIVLGLMVPLHSPALPRAEVNKFPIYEVEFLKVNKIKGNILTNFGFGSYVAYKLYPDNLIYMDGRYEEVYNNEEYLNLRSLQFGEENWKDILDKYETDIVMISHSTDVYELLEKDPDWILVYNGLRCGIFLRKENIQFNYLDPEYDINYYKKTAFDGTFGGKLWTKIK